MRQKASGTSYTLKYVIICKETRHEHATIFRRGRALSDEPAVRDRCVSEYIIRVTHAIEHARC
jgi:hypothetical protein